MSKKSLSSILITSFFLFLLIGTQATAVNYQEPELKAYSEEFQRMARKYRVEAIQVKNVSIKFGEIEEEYYGVFYTFQNLVLINPKHWKKLSFAAREQLMFHELGHVLGLDHTAPISIMQRSGLILDNYYKTNYNSLLNEFFDCQTRCPEIDYIEGKY